MSLSRPEEPKKDEPKPSEVIKKQEEEIKRPLQTIPEEPKILSDDMEMEKNEHPV